MSMNSMKEIVVKNMQNAETKPFSIGMAIVETYKDMFGNVFVLFQITQNVNVTFYSFIKCCLKKNKKKWFVEDVSTYVVQEEDVPVLFKDCYSYDTFQSAMRDLNG